MTSEITSKGTKQFKGSLMNSRKVCQSISGILLVLSLCGSIVAYFCVSGGLLGELLGAISPARIVYGWVSMVKMLLVTLFATFFPAWLLRYSESQQGHSTVDYSLVNIKHLFKKVGMIFFVVQIALPIEIYILKSTVRVIVLEQLVMLMTILTFVAFGIFVSVHSKSFPKILAISIILFFVVGIPMLLISILVGHLSRLSPFSTKRV